MMRSGFRTIAWLLMLAMLFSFSSVSLADAGDLTDTAVETAEAFEEITAAENEQETVPAEEAEEVRIVGMPLFASSNEDTGKYQVFVIMSGLISDSGEYVAIPVHHEELDEPYYVIPETEGIEAEGLEFEGFKCVETGETYGIGASIPLEKLEKAEDGYHITLVATFKKTGTEGVTYTDVDRYDVSVCILAPDDADYKTVAVPLSDSFDSLEGAVIPQITNNKILKSPLKYYALKGLSISGFKSLSSGHVYGMDEDYEIKDLPKPVYVGEELVEFNGTEGERISVYEITEYVVPLYELYGATGRYLDPLIKCNVVYYMLVPAGDEESASGYTCLGTDTVNMSMMDVVDPDPDNGGIKLDAAFPDYMEALGYTFDGYGELGSGEVTYPEGVLFADQYTTLEGNGVLTFAVELLYSETDEEATPEEILDAAKEKLSAKYQDILDDENASEGMKAVAAAAIADIEDAADKDEIIAIAAGYVDKFALQEAKDEACEELRALFPEDADEEILKIVSDDIMKAIEDGMKAVNDSESTEGFEDIIGEVRNAVNDIMQDVINFMDSRDETVSDIEDLAEEGDSEAVREIIEKAAQDAANAGDMDELSEILLKAQDDVAAQRLAEAREEAKAAVIAEQGDDTSANVVKAAEDAIAAIEAAEDIEEVNAEKEKGIEEIRKAKAANELEAAREEAKAALIAEQGGDKTANVVKAVKDAIEAIGTATTVDRTDAAKEAGIKAIRAAKAANEAASAKKETDQTERVFPYTDVEKTDECYDDIYYIWEADLMPGITDTIFDPQAEVTRATLVGILWYIEDEPVVNYEMTFTDVEDDMKYAEAIRWAQSVGLIEDDGSEIFEPEEFATREQVALILCRYAELKGFDVTERADLSEIADLEELAPEAEEAMSWAIAAEIEELVNNAELDPQGTVKREELARILHRFHVKYEEFWDEGSEF